MPNSINTLRIRLARILLQALPRCAAGETARDAMCEMSDAVGLAAKRRGCAGRSARGEDERYLTMKGRASQIGPESCVSGREVWDEALTGVLVGQV
jgi:hypothetical protein